MIAILDQSADGLPDGSYYLPWSRFSQLLIGCALALVLDRRKVPRTIARSGFGWAASCVCVLLILAAAYAGRYPHMVWEAPAIAIATTALVWHLAAGETLLRRILGARPLAWLGRRSYGVYLIHVPVFELLASHLHIRRLVLTAVMTVITIVLAAASYRFVELPFLRLKARLRPPSEAALPVGT